MVKIPLLERKFLLPGSEDKGNLLSFKRMGSGDFDLTQPILTQLDGKLLIYRVEFEFLLTIQALA